jgi:predicted nucleic acid-binding protein
MKVLVDTSVWSLALQRPKTAQLSVEHQSVVNALADLVRDTRAVLIGAIRQELLCGIKTPGQFAALRVNLAAFDDVLLSMQDYEVAAESCTTCRAKGIQGSNTDFLICAVSINHQLPIFTTDQDFEMYSQCLPIHLFSLNH